MDNLAWHVGSNAMNHSTSDIGDLSIQSSYQGNDKLVVGNGSKILVLHIG